MNEQRAIIICGGNIDDYNFYRNIINDRDLIICADSGAVHAYNLGLKPNVIIGDLDSLPEKYIDMYEKEKVEFIKYSFDKDKTDTDICLEYAMRHCDEIVLVAATGSRLDHTFANVLLLRQAIDKNKKASIINEKNEIHIIKDKIELQGEKGQLVSLIPVSEKIEGVTITGVHYPLDNVVIELGSTYGISNYFEDDTVNISVKSGYLVVILARD